MGLDQCDLQSTVTLVFRQLPVSPSLYITDNYFPDSLYVTIEQWSAAYAG